MRSPLALGTKRAFQAVPGFYKKMFSKDYLGSAKLHAEVYHRSVARVVAGRLTVAVLMTAGAPVALPVSIAHSIYYLTKEEQEKRRRHQESWDGARQGSPNEHQSRRRSTPPPVVTSPSLTTEQPSSVEDVARKRLRSSGLSGEGAADLAAFVYRGGELPELTRRDSQILDEITRTKNFDDEMLRNIEEILNEEAIPEPVDYE
jgi:hypothetical protein